MKQAPLFQRTFFVQRPVGVSSSDGTADIEYTRLHGNPTNPGRVLSGQRLYLAPGGTLDVLSDAFGGEGMGRVAYTPGLKAAIKRGEAQHTYRFELPVEAQTGTTYHIAFAGHDRIPAFTFTLECGRRPGF